MAKGRGKDPSALRAFPSGKRQRQAVLPTFSKVQPRQLILELHHKAVSELKPYVWVVARKNGGRLVS